MPGMWDECKLLVRYENLRHPFVDGWQPENLRLDANGNLKISDFGLSALPQQFRVWNSHLILIFSSFEICFDSWLRIRYVWPGILMSRGLPAGRWFVTHNMWDPQLCCPRGDQWQRLPGKNSRLMVMRCHFICAYGWLFAVWWTESHDLVQEGMNLLTKKISNMI
jgi:hypothetical protein